VKTAESVKTREALEKAIEETEKEESAHRRPSIGVPNSPPPKEECLQFLHSMEIEYRAWPDTDPFKVHHRNKKVIGIGECRFIIEIPSQVMGFKRTRRIVGRSLCSLADRLGLQEVTTPSGNRILLAEAPLSDHFDPEEGKRIAEERAWKSLRKLIRSITEENGA